MALLSSLLGHNQDQGIQERELQTDCSRSHIDWGLSSSWPGPLTGWCPVSFLLVALPVLGLAPARLPLGPRLPGSQAAFCRHIVGAQLNVCPLERVSTFVSYCLSSTSHQNISGWACSFQHLIEMNALLWFPTPENQGFGSLFLVFESHCLTRWFIVGIQWNIEGAKN